MENPPLEFPKFFQIIGLKMAVFIHVEENFTDFIQEENLQ